MTNAGFNVPTTAPCASGTLHEQFHPFLMVALGENPSRDRVSLVPGSTKRFVPPFSPVSLGNTLCQSPGKVFRLVLGCSHRCWVVLALWIFLGSFLGFGVSPPCRASEFWEHPEPHVGISPENSQRIQLRRGEGE